MQPVAIGEKDLERRGTAQPQLIRTRRTRREEDRVNMIDRGHMLVAWTATLVGFGIAFV